MLCIELYSGVKSFFMGPNQLPFIERCPSFRASFSSNVFTIVLVAYFALSGVISRWA